MMLTDGFDIYGDNPTEAALRRWHQKAEREGLTYKVTDTMAASINRLDRTQEAVKRGSYADTEMRMVPGAREYKQRMEELRAKIAVLRSEDRNAEAEEAEQERQRLKVDGFALAYGAGPITLARLHARQEEASADARRKHVIEQRTVLAENYTTYAINGRSVRLRRPELVFSRDDKSLIASSIRIQSQVAAYVDSELHRIIFGYAPEPERTFQGDDKVFKRRK